MSTPKTLFLFQKKILLYLVLLTTCFMVTRPMASLAELQNSSAGNNSDEALVGDWRGQSSCVVKPSGCQEEDSLYHLSRLASKPGWFSLKADKIVEGKPVTMGVSECSFDRAKHSLQCHLPAGTFQFEVHGNLMQGTMKLSDGTQWRNLSLKKVE